MAGAGLRAQPSPRSPWSSRGATWHYGPIPKRYFAGMSVQMTIRVDDELAAFVDAAAEAGEGSRAEVISRAPSRATC